MFVRNQLIRSLMNLQYDVDTMFSLEKRRLHLSVWHSGSFGKNDFLGRSSFQLKNDC